MPEFSMADWKQEMNFALGFRLALKASSTQGFDDVYVVPLRPNIIKYIIIMAR